MKVEEVYQRVKEVFPFDGYIDKDIERYLNIINPVLKYLRPPANILDFGGGPGDKTAMFAGLGFNCSIYDELQEDWHLIPGNRDKIYDFCKKYNIHYYIANQNSLAFKKAEFDMVMMHDVLEHLHDSPREIINDLLEFVKPQGLLFITVPNLLNLRKRLSVMMGQTIMPPYDAYFWSQGPWHGHVREYVKDDLIKLSSYLNLEILELTSCHQMLRRVPNILGKVFKAVTKVFPGWRDTWLLLARKNPGWVSIKPLPKEALFRILYSRDPLLRGVIGEDKF